MKYTGRDGLTKKETRVALTKDAILWDFGNQGYYMNAIEVTELDNEVIVYVDIKNVVVN